VLHKLLQDVGKLEEAKPLLEEDLQVSEDTLLNRHPDTLIAVNNMGMLLKGMGQLKKARPLLEKALLARRETLGDRHHIVGISVDQERQLVQTPCRVCSRLYWCLYTKIN
jgi:tetratricopeptide (TPR) repeat protein